MKAVYCSNFNKILVLFHFYSTLNDKFFFNNLITITIIYLTLSGLISVCFDFEIRFVFLPFCLTVYTCPEFKSTFTVHCVICIISNGRKSHRMLMYNFCVTCLFKAFNILILNLFTYNCKKKYTKTLSISILPKSENLPISTLFPRQK